MRRIDVVKKRRQQPARAVDFTGVSWNELRRMAKVAGINTSGLKRPEIEAALSE